MRNKIVSFIFAIIVLLSLSAYSVFHSLNRKTVISPNILLLTNPVMNFCGKVQKVEKDALWLTRTVYTQEGPSAPPKENALTYKVTIGEGTKMQYLFPIVPYLFKPRAQIKPGYLKPDMSKFKIGQVINVTSKEDLRRYLKDTFTAEFVYFPPVENVVFGIITQVGPQGLSLKAFPRLPRAPFDRADNKEEGQPQYPKDMLYTVQINPDTEISWWDNTDPSQPKALKLELSDLTIGLPVVVYSDRDIYETDNFVALLIQPGTRPALKKDDNGGKNA
jgi:hypothetical protein